MLTVRSICSTGPSITMVVKGTLVGVAPGVAGAVALGVAGGVAGIVAGNVAAGVAFSLTIRMFKIVMTTGSMTTIVGAEGALTAVSPFAPPSVTETSWPGSKTWVTPAATTLALPSTSCTLIDLLRSACKTTVEAIVIWTPFTENVTFSCCGERTIMPSRGASWQFAGPGPDVK